MIPLLLALWLAGDPPPPPPPPPAPEEIATTPKSTEALVDAAKDAKAKRKSSTTKVITNRDVKKSKGKIVERKGGSEITVTASRDNVSPLEKQNHEWRARKAAEAKVEAAEAKLKEMEQAVLRIELAYYDENDPNVRDSVVAKRFADAVRDRDAAKKQLDEAKAELDQLAPKQ